jgi:hypothetical protein
MQNIPFMAMGMGQKLGTPMIGWSIALIPKIDKQ